MNYIDLADALNELNLEIDAKLDIVDVFNKHDIEVGVCNACLEFTTHRLKHGYSTYCSYDCMINDIDVSEDDEE